MSVLDSRNYNENIYDPRKGGSKWDDRLTTFLEHHYGLSKHKCTPLEALYKTHSFLKEEDHCVEVERNCLRVFTKHRPYWFSVEYFVQPETVCNHCGGRMHEPTSWARPCHVCSKDKEILTASCGSNRFTVCVVNKRNEEIVDECRKYL